MELSKMRWKYLRESKMHHYDPERHTSLDEYLDYIFHGYEFEYDVPIPKPIVFQRNCDATYRRFRPDARCESLSLIIEFDGLPHYQDPQIILSDKERDAYLRSLGYTVVRIPYWIQLSTDVVYNLFNAYTSVLTLDPSEPLCTLHYSFCDVDKTDVNLSTSIGAMCETGRTRFIEQVTALPIQVQLDVYLDLIEYIHRYINMYSDGCAADVVPPTVISRWGIEFSYLPSIDDNITEQNLQEQQLREAVLFGRAYAHTTYEPFGLDCFDITRFQYDAYIKYFGQFDSLHHIHTHHELITDITNYIDALLSDQALDSDDFILCGVRMDLLHPQTGVYLNGFTTTLTPSVLQYVDHLKQAYEESIEKHLFICQYDSAAGKSVVSVWIA